MLPIDIIQTVYGYSLETELFVYFCIKLPNNFLMKVTIQGKVLHLTFLDQLIANFKSKQLTMVHTLIPRPWHDILCI